jgi:hypothetical protein
MAERILKIWYDKDMDLLEVSWGHKIGYLAGTEHDWILANVDMEGNLQGFQIEGVTQLEGGVLKIRVPPPENTEEKSEKPQKSRH